MENDPERKAEGVPVYIDFQRRARAVSRRQVHGVGAPRFPWPFPKRKRRQVRAHIPLMLLLCAAIALPVALAMASAYRMILVIEGDAATKSEVRLLERKVDDITLGHRQSMGVAGKQD